MNAFLTGFMLVADATIRKSPVAQILSIQFKHSPPARMMLYSQVGTLYDPLDAPTAYRSRSLIPPSGARIGSKVSS